MTKIEAEFCDHRITTAAVSSIREGLGSKKKSKNLNSRVRGSRLSSNKMDFEWVSAKNQVRGIGKRIMNELNLVLR